MRESSPPRRACRKSPRLHLAAFFAGDRLQPLLGEIAAAALRCARADHIDSKPAGIRCSFSSCHHGPTAAFKDFGARFLAESLQRLEAAARSQPLTILVATSGDTGGAVAAAFHRRPWARVVILFPKGLVSPRQEQQLTCWGDNVLALRIDGTFDDCQRTGQGCFPRSCVEPAASLQLRQQHQYRPAAAADGLLHRFQSGYRHAYRDEAVLHRSGRQSRQCVGGRLGARHGLSHRAHHSGAQHQSHGS